MTSTRAPLREMAVARESQWSGKHCRPENYSEMAATTTSSPLGLAPEADNADGEPHDRANLQLRHLHQRVVLRDDLAMMPWRHWSREQLEIQQLQRKWLGPQTPNTLILPNEMKGF